MDSRLVEDTFTSEEVKDMLTGIDYGMTFDLA